MCRSFETCADSDDNPESAHLSIEQKQHMCISLQQDILHLSEESDILDMHMEIMKKSLQHLATDIENTPYSYVTNREMRELMRCNEADGVCVHIFTCIYV